MCVRVCLCVCTLGVGKSVCQDRAGGSGGGEQLAHPEECFQEVRCLCYHVYMLIILVLYTLLIL